MILGLSLMFGTLILVCMFLAYLAVTVFDDAEYADSKHKKKKKKR